MKKINSFILFGAAVFAFAACSNETQIENSPKPQEPVYETLSVKIGTEPTTRVSLDGTNGSKSVFETGDKIAVWTGAGTFQDCDVKAGGTISVDVSGGARSNYAVYYTGTTAPTFVSSTLKITLPDTYAYADVSGDKNPVPMVAKNVAGDDADMTFYAVCGLARITLTGIPATATKLIATFSHDVTGEFTVTNPGTPSPSISAAARSTKNVITINLTPGTDYTGAVINLPVPVGNEINIHIDAYKGSDPLQCWTFVVNNWNAARAHGKKATCAFTPSMASMILAPGNLYTDGSGDLHMADNYYEYIYSDYGNFANDASWNINNRSHFNYNETYYLMKTGTVSQSDAFTNVGSYETPAVTSGFGTYYWRVPTHDNWVNMTTGSRPGTTLSNDGGSSYTSGWKFIKILVSGMSPYGLSSTDGTATSFNSDYLSGLLLFPDNVKITGTYFSILGTQNQLYSTDFNTTTITMTNLDALIAAGCAFLPATGRCYLGNWSTGVGNLGTYWTCTESESDDTKGYYLQFDSGFDPSISFTKSDFFRPVRLVRDIQ